MADSFFLSVSFWGSHFLFHLVFEFSFRNLKLLNKEVRFFL